MKDERIFRIEEPHSRVLSPLSQGFKDYDIVGLDTETIKGDLYSLQVFSKDLNLSKFILYNGEGDTELLKRIVREVNPKRSLFFFCHNLEFDMGVIFQKAILYNIEDSDFDVGWQGSNDVRYKIFYPNPCYLKVTLKGYFRGRDGRSHDLHCYFADTFPFFLGSLERMAKDLKLPVKKLEKPSYLGERKPNDEEMDYFVNYAMIDAELVYYLGKEYENFHRKYDVNTKMTISPASLSAKVFKRKFLKRKIRFTDDSLINYYALRSYWGGRTEAFCGGSSAIKIYDYNSFYPYAMSRIFIPIEPNKWKYTDSFTTPFGFYRIRGTIPDMKVSPLLKKTERLIFPIGKFDEIMTGFEAENVLQYAKDVTRIDGYVYAGQEDYSLKDYVEHFYREKQMIDRREHPADYLRTKLFLNSLYGKTIQMNVGRTYYHVLTPSKEYVKYGHRIESGGIFCPIVASWITGLCRAELFRAMKKHEDSVMYCDTDSIGISADNYDVKTSDFLGGLKLEGKGEGTIIREKNYFIRGDVRKTARHGFWGNDEEFESVVRGGIGVYSVTKMVKLLESYRQSKKPFVMERRMRSLELVTSKKRADSRPMDFLHDFKWLNPLKSPSF